MTSRNRNISKNRTILELLQFKEWEPSTISTVTSATVFPKNQHQLVPHSGFVGTAQTLNHSLLLFFPLTKLHFTTTTSGTFATSKQTWKWLKSLTVLWGYICIVFTISYAFQRIKKITKNTGNSPGAAGPVQGHQRSPFLLQGSCHRRY